MNKKQTGMAAGAITAFLSICAVSAIFMTTFKTAGEKITASSRAAASAELNGKAALESEWATKKNLFESGQTSSEFLNAWLKEFITYAQGNTLKIDKLEPAGEKDGPNGKETTVFISFQSDMRKFSEFLYFLLEKDPLARVQSVFIRQDENSKKLSFEMMIGKPGA